jgi:hypothetical protein
MSIYTSKGKKKLHFFRASEDVFCVGSRCCAKVLICVARKGARRVPSSLNWRKRCRKSAASPALRSASPPQRSAAADYLVNDVDHTSQAGAAANQTRADALSQTPFHPLNGKA